MDVVDDSSSKVRAQVTNVPHAGGPVQPVECAGARA